MKTMEMTVLLSCVLIEVAVVFIPKVLTSCWSLVGIYYMECRAAKSTHFGQVGMVAYTNNNRAEETEVEGSRPAYKKDPDFKNRQTDGLGIELSGRLFA